MAGSRARSEVLAGPILRRVESQRIVLWLAVGAPVRLRLVLNAGDDPTSFVLAPGEPGLRCLTAAQHLHYLLVDVALTSPLPEGRWIGYSLEAAPLDGVADDWRPLTAAIPDLCHPGRETPGFVFAPRVSALLFGSCRKPHFDGGDGLVEADRLIGRLLAADAVDDDSDRDGEGTGGSGEGRAGCSDGGEAQAWPSMLVLCGDQVYADDVAGPMLRAIHGLVAKLGFPVEALDGAEECGAPDSDALYAHPDGYYRREKLLPRRKGNAQIVEILFGGVEKPVFTTDNAHNHLVTLAEVLAMYLLAWSPAAWDGLDLAPPPGLDQALGERYARERRRMQGFIDALPAVRRLFAHIPVAMIFDDHDITDDWNLSREWEEVAYGHPFSRRVIGNAVVGYLINQAWGNRPEAFDDATMQAVETALARPGSAAHDDCIGRLLDFRDWHYTWPTTPPLVVIDTRTHRWRSERTARRPSGLMDWEALTDLQHRLRDQPAVLLVSPAPIFGVKLIETLQRVVTWLGHPLTVDAENWMAHRGAAHTMLNLFRHPKTPQNFVVLSGDVHYSFVYDVELRGRVRGPDIWQICSSGLRNAFPSRLLDVLDRSNRWLFSPRSPLNWFTRRRGMRVIARQPQGAGSRPGRRLVNGAGIGLVELDGDGVPVRIVELQVGGGEIEFVRSESDEPVPARAEHSGGDGAARGHEGRAQRESRSAPVAPRSQA